jgi:TonB family protein
MKTLLKYSAVLALSALAVTRLCAAIESLKIEPTIVPSLNPVLLNRGITEGTVTLVIDVSAEGKLTDWLVLGSTDPEIAEYFVDALKAWKITPARIDGKPVGSQVELSATVTAQGVVLSRTGMELVNDFFRRISGNPIKYQRSSATALDHLPARLNTITPKYAQDAAKQGVHGKVQVSFYIDEHGTVRMPAVNAGAHPYLAEEAVAAVREWKFEPPTSKGKPVLVAASQEFNFNGTK